MSAALKRLWMALALATVLTVGTSARAADPVLVWHAYRGEEKQALEQVLSAWQKRTGIPVEALQVPHDAYASKLAAAAPRGHGPHVFIDSHERLGDLVERSAAKELPALSPAEAAQYQPRALEALTDGDHVRGLPIALKCIALYVNPALLAKVPDTLEGIFALKEQLPPGVFPIAYEANNVYFHAAILHAFGGAQLLPNGDFGFVGPAAEKSVELVRSAVEMGAVPEEASGALVDELFKSGRAATVMSGPYFASDIGNAVKYRVVPLPKIAAANAPMKPFLTVEAVALTPKGVQRPDAEKLARFIAGPESAAIRARVGRQVVARAELPEVARNDPFLTAFAEQAKVAVVMPSTPRMRATWEPARRALVKSLNGTVAPAAALAEAQRRFDDVVRPPPPPASPTPLLFLIGGLCVAGAVWLFRKRDDLGPAFRRSLPAYRWVAHAVIAVGLLVFLPIIVGAGASLYAGRLGSMHYVGFANFVAILTARGGALLSTGSFWVVLLVTVLWTLVNVVLHVGIGFVLGLLLSRPALALKPIYRVLLIVPWAVPSYVTALAWRGMFSRQFGAISALIEAFGGEPFSWWARFSTAFTANVATNVWLGFPFMMVVTLGALTGVPKEVLEAAEVDGATRWQRMWRVTVPMVVPAMLPAVLLGAIWTFNMFNVVFLVSGGEPDGTTDILVSEAYRWAFTRQAQYGYAAAYSVLIFLLLWFGSRMMSRVARTT
ncbi:MAG: extracellular solute-binding protein [Myxococcales bacterium]|nr:extracellular solute-binding protein [Myxococcales bacterium]MCB9582681.1 extracellular solute-binding protein [Polyangiaceae bacterium]